MDRNARACGASAGCRRLLLAALCLSLASPLTAGELSVVPIRTKSEEKAFAGQFPEMARLSQRAVVIPGLNSKYVPQGVAWMGSGELALVTHFWDADVSPRASAVTVVRMSDGKVTATALLALPGVRGSQAYTGHVGGAAVLGGHLWTGSNGVVHRFPLPRPDSPVSQSVLGIPAFNPFAGLARPSVQQLVAEESFRLDSKVSFLSADTQRGMLWAGDFRHAGDERYSVPAHHSGGGKHAWIAGYTIRDGRPTASVRYTVDGKQVLKPDRVLLVRDDVQGMAVCGNTLAMSVSYGVKASKLAFYNAPGKDGELTLPLPGRQSVKARELDDRLWWKTVAMPANSEDLEWTGSRLLVGFESAATAYRDSRRRAKLLVEDRLHELTLPR